MTTSTTTRSPHQLPAMGVALYDSAIAEVNRTRAEINRLTAQLAELMDDLDEVIAQRDDAEAWADRLAAAIAPPEVLGEYTSTNDPWCNALDHAQSDGGAR